MTGTHTWARHHGPWHLTDTDTHTHCGTRLGPDRADFEGVPNPHCKICATRRRHQLAHKPPPPVNHHDLDLNKPTDRDLYRKRVADAYELTQLNTLIQFVIDAGGQRPPARRRAAALALADAWIRQATS